MNPDGTDTGDTAADEPVVVVYAQPATAGAGAPVPGDED